MTDYYSTLGVGKNANADEIKQAYRRLAGKHHPDKGGDTATFQKIEEAYRILSDPQQRQQYDNPINQGNPFQGFPGGGFQFNMNGFNMDEIFGQMFRQQHNNPFNQQNTYRTTYWISLEHVYNGGEEVLKLQTPTGAHMVKVNIPKGIQDGGQVRYEKVIDSSDLIVEYRIHPHLKYERRINDLYSNHPISVLDLIVGSTFEFVTISGKKLEVTVQPNTQPYMHLKLNNQGLPIQGTNIFGDQIILLKPFIPDNIDSRITDSILLSKAQ
jgi:DnaJ-class molecular chaperone